MEKVFIIRVNLQTILDESGKDEHDLDQVEQLLHQAWSDPKAKIQVDLRVWNDENSLQYQKLMLSRNSTKSEDFIEPELITLIAQRDVRTHKYHNLIPGQKSPQEFNNTMQFWNGIYSDHPELNTGLSQRQYRENWVAEYQQEWNHYWGSGGD